MPKKKKKKQPSPLSPTEAARRATEDTLRRRTREQKTKIRGPVTIIELTRRSAKRLGTQMPRAQPTSIPPVVRSRKKKKKKR